MFLSGYQSIFSCHVLDVAHQRQLMSGLKNLGSSWSTKSSFPARNADESGFPLCPKSGRVLAMKTDKNVYGVTGDSMCWECCWRHTSTNAGVCCRYNPMDKCIPNAYFGRSPNGWINILWMACQSLCKVSTCETSSAVGRWIFFPYRY